ncbi:hypothetical protein T492DRAFT_832978 [Pavlovales sp. CCMP2436]|nr:hypothetical protein T492DRAFT_832978 [Pavlovales sp. CCMP2436]
MVDDVPRSSALHLEVSAKLARMGIAHSNELPVPLLGYRVDIAISPASGSAAAGGGATDRRLDKVAARAREAVRAVTAGHAGIAIEVDGPTHYDGEQRLRPASEMIRRHLALAGWAVLTVPHWEWCALTGGKAGKAAYFAALLERAVVAKRN